MTEGDTSAHFLQFLDRVMAPVHAQLSNMDGKLDRALAMGERVGVVESEVAPLKQDIRELQSRQAQHASELAEAKGRNKIIVGVLTLVGAPLVVTLAGAGICALLGIHL